jgi:hypothetical protein
MFGLFTKNLDAMERATKKKNIGELDNLKRLKKEEMEEFLGGTENGYEKKKKRFFFGLFNPSPCQSEPPQ